MVDRNSLKLKISFTVIAILAVILLLNSTLIFMSFRKVLYQELDRVLVVKTQRINNAVLSYLDVLGRDQASFEFSVSRVIAQTGEHAHKNKIERLEKLWLGQMMPLGLGGDYIEFLDASGNKIVRSNNDRFKYSLATPKDIKHALANHPVLKDITIGEENLRVLVAPAVYDMLPQNKKYVIAIATSRERIRYFLKQRLIAKVGYSAVILFFASFLSYFLTNRILKPINDIVETAQNINYKDLSVRLKGNDTYSEVRILTDTLNEMLSRLQRSFEYNAEFSSHVSHELKTPLAILRGESELVLRSKHTEEEYRMVIQGNLEEIARMTKIVEDLLLLTKLEHQPDVFNFEKFDLVLFLKEIEESGRILAREKEIVVDSDLPNAPVMVQGDKVHLRRLFFNLVNNSIKFTYPGGKIHIQLSREGSLVQISIVDTGIGISEQNLPKIFDKFFHHNSSGVDVPGGNGLGLSIAYSIAKIHFGDISVKSRVGEGTTVTVGLPIVPAGGPF